MISILNAHYLTLVTASGAAAGASAIVPNVAVQVPVAIVDVVAFLEASVLYTLSVAEVHGLHIEDFERRKLLVTAVLVGDKAASAAMKPLFNRTVPYWGKKIVNAIPMAAIDAANRVLGPRFITKYGTKQGVLVLGKQVPAFIGVAIGAGGNHAFGWFVIGAAKKILGPPPAQWGGDNASGSDAVPVVPA